MPFIAHKDLPALLLSVLKQRSLYRRNPLDFLIFLCSRKPSSPGTEVQLDECQSQTNLCFFLVITAYLVDTPALDQKADSTLILPFYLFRRKAGVGSTCKYYLLL